MLFDRRAAEMILSNKGPRRFMLVGVEVMPP
jgi:hypothetical protein